MYKKQKTKKLSLRHIGLKLSKINDNEIIPKAVRENKKVIYKEKSYLVIIGLLSGNSISQKRMEPNIEATERKKSPAKNNISRKIIFQIRYRNKNLSRHTETKGIYHQRTFIAGNSQGVVLPETNNKRSHKKTE